jgi:hypothetical protein
VIASEYGRMFTAEGSVLKGRGGSLLTVAPLVDLVWAVANDGEYHTVKELAERVRSPSVKLVEAATFLIKYGFAEPAYGSRSAFRMIPRTPSPAEAAEGLRSLLLNQ